MTTAPPPDYKDLFTPGDPQEGGQPSAPPPAGHPGPYPSQPAPYPSQPAPYPSQPPQAVVPYPPAPLAAAPYQGYPAPTYPPQSQNTTVVVNQSQSQQTTVITKKSSPNHALHCVICFFCPWYLCCWLIICCVYGC